MLKRIKGKSWQLIMKCFNLVTKNFMHCSSSKMKELFPSNYQLNTCLQGKISKQRQPLYFSMIIYNVAIHEVLTYLKDQDTVSTLHKHVLPFSFDYSLTEMSAGKL